MRRLLFLALLGCASSGQTTQTTHRAILTGSSGELRENPTEQAPSVVIGAPPDAVMRALLGAYEGAGITVTLVDPAKRRLGNPGFNLRRALLGTPLSEYLNCGESMTGLRANDDRVTMSLISVVRPTPRGSEIETRIEASAREIQGGNTADQLLCQSTGKLETKIHQITKETLAK